MLKRRSHRPNIIKKGEKRILPRPQSRKRRNGKRLIRETI